MNNLSNLAIELLNNKKNVYELDCKQLEKLTKYFDNEIIRKRRELEEIKNDIIQIKNKLDY